MTPTPTSHGTTIKRKGSHPCNVMECDCFGTTFCAETILFATGVLGVRDDLSGLTPDPHFATTRLHAPQ